MGALSCCQEPGLGRFLVHRGPLCWGTLGFLYLLRGRAQMELPGASEALAFFPAAEIRVKEKVCSLQDRGAHALHRTAGEGAWWPSLARPSQILTYTCALKLHDIACRGGPPPTHIVVESQGL